MFRRNVLYEEELIGNQNHLIAISGDVLFVFQPSVMINGPLLSYKGSFAFKNAADPNLVYPPSLTWACSELPNTFGCFSNESSELATAHGFLSHVSLWELNDTTTEQQSPVVNDGNNEWKPIKVQTFDITTIAYRSLKRIAIGERCLAVATTAEEEKYPFQIHIFDRKTQRRQHIIQDGGHDLPPNFLDDFVCYRGSPCIELLEIFLYQRHH